MSQENVEIVEAAFEALLNAGTSPDRFGTGLRRRTSIIAQFRRAG